MDVFIFFPSSTFIFSLPIISDDMDADSIDLAHSDVLTLLDSHLEDVVETEDYLQWVRNLGHCVVRIPFDCSLLDLIMI